jgi:transcriptional regulator with XRE-family HTH domain
MPKKMSDLKGPVLSPGGLVRAMRTSFGLTMRELSEITKIPEPNLSDIENGKTEIGVKRAVLLAGAFGVEPEQIMFPRGYVRPAHEKLMDQVARRADAVFTRKRKAVAAGSRK